MPTGERHRCPRGLLPNDMTNHPPIDRDQALNRLRSLPPRMLTVDTAYYVIYGVAAPTPRKERIRRVLKATHQTIMSPVRAVYNRCSEIWRANSGQREPWSEVRGEQALSGAKAGRPVFHLGDLELFMRRNRWLMYHPLLGLEITTLVIPDTGPDGYRISPDDLARYLKGEPPVEYDSGSLNLIGSIIGKKTSRGSKATS